MKLRPLLIFLLFVAGAVSGVLLSRAVEAAPDNVVPKAAPEEKDKSVVWKEVKLASREKLGEDAHRLDERPGNFPVLAAMSDFCEGLYALRPELRHVAYPMNYNGMTFETAEQWEEHLRKKEADAGKDPSNKNRSYNFVFYDIPLHEVRSEELPTGVTLGDTDKKRFDEARKKHKELGYLIPARFSFVSLQSKKVEGGDGKSPYDIILFIVKKPDGWKVVWFDT